MLNKLAVLNIALVTGHQIDAAYWREWEMFGLPGGIQLFVAVNVVLYLVLIGCLVLLVQRGPAGYYASLLIAGACGLVLPIHAGFALYGFGQFNLPVSIVVIVATFVGALWLAGATLARRGEFRATA